MLYQGRGIDEILQVTLEEKKSTSKKKMSHPNLCRSVPPPPPPASLTPMHTMYLYFSYLSTCMLTI